MKPSSVRSFLPEAVNALREAGVDSPEVDARLLAAHVLGVAPMQLMFADVPADFGQRYTELVARRTKREPLQHIIGTAPFYGVDLAVGPGVFIPRPETEVLAEWAVQKLIDAPSDPTVVDLGSGTGALAIAVARARPDATVYAVERSEAARAYLQRNVDTLAPQVNVVAGDMTDPQLLAGIRADVVVSNPPYVPETPELQQEVYADPHEAVFSGVDGLAAIRGIVPVVKQMLKDGGVVGIEHDDTTSEAVQDELRAGGFADVRAMEDLTGRARFVTASKLAR
ncbi:peptide chain release factor N(5)-glutamine methyltransferase [Corynebacterium afermentans subsp. lipophilum]|uniref:peptide chain release factor N(5)-glutamine methyltransferase n=1 Tax=Corynebacterium afermentans TaxID=38286 RepID=UPI00188D205E|nr:peptide chain release factor N(5)-glutamine methyltransferase [Corynebacterium afermentans]MBF4547595.1 peptide chain release factor N(5)-glutamine methyltransferase [Corynebacterium afermentans subsp. lipophilum]WJY58691.1 Release factor glutamine methyltransferase [Corynebacterium afermentans subsp. lipophilum]